MVYLLDKNPPLVSLKVQSSKYRAQSTAGQQHPYPLPQGPTCRGCAPAVGVPFAGLPQLLADAADLRPREGCCRCHSQLGCQVHATQGGDSALVNAHPGGDPVQRVVLNSMRTVHGASPHRNEPRAVSHQGPSTVRMPFATHGAHCCSFLRCTREPGVHSFPVQHERGNPCECAWQWQQPWGPQVSSGGQQVHNKQLLPGSMAIRWRVRGTSPEVSGVGRSCSYVWVYAQTRGELKPSGTRS
jgi:hypothetical protein